MKTRLLLSLLLTLCFAYSWAHDVVVDNIYYDLNRSEKEAIVVFKGTSYTSQTPWYSGGITIPESINVGGVDYAVTYIHYSAFYKCTNVTSVTLPNTIKSIGSHAFYGCRSLESIIFSESLTTIDSEAFSGCTSLKSVLLPNSLEEIGRYCFELCKFVQFC